jgi:arylsulfatase A-like enzyme
VGYPKLVLSGPPKTRLHVLLLTVDTLRADYVSAYGYDRPTTPFLDSLIARGVRFTRAITPMARTTPALSSLMTGCYPHTTEVRTLFQRLPKQLVPVAQLARRKGYATVAVVANNILKGRNLNRGFDVFDVVNYPRDAVETTDAVLRHLQAYGREEPLFVWAHYVDPHMPYHPPPELAVQFDPDYDGRYKLHFGDLHRGLASRAYPDDLPKDQAVFQNHLPDSVNGHIRRLYAAEIRHTDDQIARLITGLRARFGDDWLIVFTADHGESLGEHNYFYDHGDYVYDPELHVPLAFIFPQDDPLRTRRVVDARVSLVDVMPTLMELLELPRPLYLSYDMEGRSLMPAFLGKPLPLRPVFAESGGTYEPQMVPRRVQFDIDGRFRAVFLGNWKLIWTPGRTGDDQFELYNLAKDTGETHNLYALHLSATGLLESALGAWSETWRVRTATAKHAVLTDRDMEILRSLGYMR